MSSNLLTEKFLSD